MLGRQIASIHNLGFYCSLLKQARNHIIDGDFLNWKNIPSEALWSLNHNFGHQSAYDFQLLSDLLLRAGFKEFRKCSFNMSKDPKKAREEFIARQAMGRLAQPEEIASLAVYLASDESDFVTGTLNLIDGGWTL